MEFTYKQLVDSFTKKYITDIGNQIYFELFAIFDLIMKEYEETNKCPICTNEEYGYNNTTIIYKDKFFYVGNGIVSFGMKVNYCPICGRHIEKD